MSRNIRIRTEPNAGDNHIKIQLNQDFDFLEILSLKISQEDVYRSFYSNYGVVVGRVIMNSGVGVPNARVSIFIPLTDEDAEDPEIFGIYPYTDLAVLSDDGIRYNTLPKDAQGVCHAAVGTFPTKRELIDNDPLFEIFEKYYKYTTTTNGAGDFMLFGVPVGNHTLNIDVDVSDMGIFSQRPYDLIEQGNPKKLFDSPTKFKTGTNLNNLTQLRNRQVGVNVIPFWGQQLSNEVGISRVDVDINYNIKPQAIFIGSIFGDNEKNGINKNCRPRKKMGSVCDMGEGDGTIQMIRKNILGETEKLDIEGGQLINDNGVWAYQIPMNLDYMVTDEFGRLVPSDDPNKGIATRSRMRFKVSMNETGGNGRLRTMAKYLIPHNPKIVSEANYSFDESTPDIHFRDLYWNKIYTVKNHIARFQKNRNKENRNFIGFKDVDNCVGLKNPLPFNKIDTDFNPLYFILCLIISIILAIIGAINSIIKGKFLGIRLCKVLGLKCVGIMCDSNRYTPSCSGKCREAGENSSSRALTCFKTTLAETLNVFEFDFYNEWLNGGLYSFLLKYKKTKGSEKFCGEVNNESASNGDNNNYIVNTNYTDSRVSDSPQTSELNEGVVVSFEDELFYKPLGQANQRLYNTDIYSLGSVFNCDWQSIDRIQPALINTSYQIPPLVSEVNEAGATLTTGLSPLLFSLDCVKVDVNTSQSRSIRRICEIGVGLDDVDEGVNPNGYIGDEDIENGELRSQLIKLNDPNFEFDDLIDINSNFNGAEYKSYRGVVNNDGIEQFTNSFYFYFGTKPNNTALNLMNSKYFTDCSKIVKQIINITGIVTNVKTVGGTNGSIDITVQGGLGPYTYQWYNFDYPTTLISITEDVNDLSEGTYFVVVTDSNGLSVKKTFVVRGLQDLMVNISSRNTKSPSESTGIIFINSITGGIGPYDVNITGPTGTTYNDIPYSVNFGTNEHGLPAGNYTVIITDSNSPMDTYTEVVTIGVPLPLVVSDTRLSPNCAEFEDGRVIITIVGGTPEYSIVFKNVTDPLNFITLPNNYDQNTGVADYDGLPSGIYTYKVEDEYGQSWPLQTFTLVEPLELTLTRSAGDLTASNLLVGQTYSFQLGGTEQYNFTATNTTKNIGSYVLDTNRYQIISQFGCVSETIE